MVLETLVRHRRALHRIPEIRFDLPKTQAYVMEALRPLSCALTPVAGTGVLAWFDNGKEHTTAFRADMDALPVTERTCHDFPSLHPGRMHACGHDGHMAMLLTFAEWVDAHRGELKRNILLIFQPSEEVDAGGEQVVLSGCLEQYRVDRIFAFHVDPNYPMGVVATRPGPLYAHASNIHLLLEGAAGHAAVPGAGKDALAAGVDFIYEAYRAEREIPKAQPRRLKFCQLTGGNVANIVAREVEIKGTMRTHDDADDLALRDMLGNLAAEVEARYGVKACLSITGGYPRVHNDPALLEAVRRVAEIQLIPEPIFIGEDFSYYQQKIPGVIFQLGLGGGEPLHSDQFDLDERALMTGVELDCKLAEME